MDELKAPRPLAVVTGASTGIGYRLARCAVEHGHDLIVAADTPLAPAVSDFEALGAKVESLQADLATTQGTQQLVDLVGDRPIAVLMANAGHGLGKSFLEQDFPDILHVINTNITGTLHLVQHVARGMVKRGQGRILITGSVAGFMPGSFQAVYNGTKAFIDSFALALNNELKDSGVTVTCLMPGPTDTEFFVRADLLDTRVGQGRKSAPEEVARIGFQAMLKGEADVVAGLKNKLEVAMTKVLPGEKVAEMHRHLTEPGSGKDH